MNIVINSFSNGIATNVDPNDIGNEYAVVTQNFLLDQPGRLVKRPGRSATVTISSLSFTDVKYWSPSNLKINGTAIDDKWIGYDAAVDKLIFTPSNILGGVTGTALGSAYTANIPSDFDLQDHGTEFRMAPNNLNHGPKILQHISRNFFTGNYSVDEFVFQDALLPTSSDISFVSLEESASAAGYAMTVNETNSYKLSPVYDGIQERPLSSVSKSITTSASNRSNQIKFTLSATSSGSAPNKTYGFNPRMTAVKVYRETSNSGTYFHVGTVPINTKAGNDNVLASTTTYKTGTSAVYATAFINKATDMTTGNGIFTNFDTGQSENQNVTVEVKYYAVKTSATTKSAIQSQGFNLFGGINLTGTSTTNAPATDSTFTTNLANGFIETTQNTGNTQVDFFNEEIKIVRMVIVDDNQNQTLTETIDETEIIGIGSCHANQLVFHTQSNNDLFSVGQYNGGFLKKGNNHYVIEDTLGKAVKINNPTSGFNSAAVQIFKSYIEEFANDTATYHFYDLGFTSGAQQPFVDDAKVRVHYKYSQMLNDRLFVGNVKLDPGVDGEDHPDWIIYSEPGMPDVLPVVNYIQIKDQQGGQMMALNKMLDSLVVFMSRGTFRLDVNSIGDPSSWQLMESEKNIGCVAKKSVVNVKDNLFFCSNDAVYQISPDFRFTPISEAIKDVYQASTNKENSRLMYDVKRNRLLCRFGDVIDTIYAYDLISNGWSTLKFNSSASSFYSIDDTLDVFGFFNTIPQQGAPTNCEIHRIHQSGSTENVEVAYETGFTNITKMDVNTIVRRVNLNYESSAALTCKVYTNGDNSTVRGTLTFPANNVSKDYLVSIRPAGIRAKSIALRISATTNADVKINKVEIETDE